MQQKNYINVIAECTIAGITPLAVIDYGGSSHCIEQIIERRDFPGTGLRFTCLLYGKPQFLWYKNKRWFVFGKLWNVIE